MGWIGLAAAVACGGSSNGNGTFSNPDGSVSDDGGIGADGSGDDVGQFGGDTAPPITYGCSADLHDVIDSNGVLVKHCPADQGCDAGTCVPACQAAGDGHGNIGCDFMVATPSFFAGEASYFSPCFAVFLANNWGTPMTIAVSRAGVTYDATKFGRIPVAGQPESSWAPVPAAGVPPGQVAVLFLDQAPSTNFACPVTPALSTATAVAGTGRGLAWHIVTGAPVSAYDILPYGGAASLLPSAELLFPTSAWGTNYIAVVPKMASGSNTSAPGPQWGQILAVQDNTQVQVVSTVALPGGTNVVAAPANAVTTYTLAAGEFVQWQNPYTYPSPGAAPMEMSGSILQSNHPIAFMGGNGYLCLGSQTSTGGGCDSGHQQIAPVAALGSEYAVGPYTTRRADLQEESIPYRIVGMVKGTTLTYDPPVTGAPATLDLGKWTDFEATGAFVVKSQDAQHPFYIGQMMSGCQVTSGSRPPGSAGSGDLGDEEFVNVMPSQQFLSSYVFFTDGTYPTTTFTFVRSKTSTGFSDVTLDCLTGPLTGWKPVGASGNYEWTTVDLVRGGVGPGTCKNGPHSSKSAGPFGLTVWGLSTYASYGYPAGTNIAPINTVVIPPTPQ
ncbi:MAG TPA: IgGFc-binding protein [Polyangiaceae bacterium]|jgi:hypothetical protein